MRLFGWELSRATEPVDQPDVLAEVQREYVALTKDVERIRDLVCTLTSTVEDGLAEIHQGFQDIDIRPQIKVDQPAPVVEVNTEQFDAALKELGSRMEEMDVRIDEAVASVVAASNKSIELAGEQLRQLIALPEVKATVATGYQRILREKGQAGRPRKCDVCGSVFSDRLDSCDRCGRRKNEMPQSTLLED